MQKNVVVCCDGTANEFAKDKTNVVKLYSTLHHEPGVQVTSYHPGIGTMEPPGAVTDIGRKTTRLLGMAVGYGLENDIRDAYVYIMRNFQPGDQLYLFGFSRGAYTVRAVASMLRMYGLIRAGHEPLVPYAIRMLTSVSSNQKDQRVGAAFQLADDFKETFCSIECKPHFVGVWDTVSSVGWIENPLKLPFIANNPDIEIARHAVAIDEKRAFFRTNLWRPSDKGPNGPRDMKQVWFPGVHCDVGGGYAEDQSGLSKFALEWMLAEAEKAGLLIDRQKAAQLLGKTGDKRYAPADADACIHESLTWEWWAAEFVPKKHFDFKTKKTARRMSLFRRRTIPPGSVVHESVLQRSGGYAKRVPTNVQIEKTTWAAAAARAASQSGGIR